MSQSELQLENELIGQLVGLGFETVQIQDVNSLELNLRSQLEKFNQLKFSDSEFSRILNHLNKGDRFQKAKTLRNRFVLTRDDDSTIWIRFSNMDQWCRTNTKSPTRSHRKDALRIDMT
jgi:type I restriction enzyme R subunit